MESDFCKGLDKRTLREEAIPSVFPDYPSHKQPTVTSKRSSPVKRKMPPPATSVTKVPKVVSNEHSYAHSSVESHLQNVKQELQKSKEKARVQSFQLKNQKKKLVRRDKKNWIFVRRHKEIKPSTRRAT